MSSMNLQGVYPSFAVSRAARRPSKIGICRPDNILEIMRILVTGGAGFIGGNLVNRLVSMGVGEVLVLDNLHRGFSRDSLPAAAEFRNALADNVPASLVPEVQRELQIAEGLAGSTTTSTTRP